MQFQYDREHHISVHGKKISVIEWGDEKAPPILCLHGWLDNAASFHYLAPYLKKRYRLIAIELPGHGQSDHLSKDADYQFVAAISTIDAIIDVLNIHACDVIGHSMGGALGLIYAGVMPERFKRLALIDSFGAITQQSDNIAEQLNQALLARRKIASNKRFFDNIDIAAKARAQVSELDWKTLYPLIERGVCLTKGGYQWSSDARLKNTSWLRITESQHDSILKAVETPVLLLEAEQGILNQFPLEHRKSLLKNLEHHVMVGGHHFHMQYPEITAQKIRTFFEQ